MIEANITIMQAWNELKGINNKIDLFEKLRKVNGNIKATKVKEILIESGFVNDDAMLNIVMRKDEYTDRLKALYDSKKAYEEFIKEEITRLKISDIQIAIGYLKEYEKNKWEEIAKKLNYSIAQCRRYYDEYKGRTPKNNSQIYQKNNLSSQNEQK